MTACSEREMALHALVDGELDALDAVALEAHLRGCAGCRDELQRIEHVREALADPALRPAAPAGLKARIVAQTASRPTPRPAARWTAFGGGSLTGALAASLLLMLAVPRIAEPGIADEIIGGQIRSLQASHLVDVVTSNRHVVKPWFNGRIDFSPPVADLAPQGFPLVGGRLDVVGGRTVAVLVYGRRLHRINLFVRPAPALASPFASEMRRASYSLVRWRAGGLEYWAVSDIEPAELQQFRRTFENSTAE
jgi:anti-sigma factor RsiW